MMGDYRSFFCLKSLIYVSFFDPSLNKVVISQRFRYFLVFRVIASFGLSLTCYNVMVFIVLLQYFICVGAI